MNFVKSVKGYFRFFIGDTFALLNMIRVILPLILILYI